MNAKSKISLIALTSLLSLGAVSCGSKKEDGRTTITVWTTFNTDYQAVIDKAVAKFEQTYTDYKIKYVKQETGYSGLKDLVIKGVAAGDYPDVTVVYPDSVADFLQTGKALNIEPYMKNSEYGWTTEDFQDIPEAFIEEGQKYAIPGTFSLPACKSTEALFWNKDKLDGLDLSSYDDEINDGEPIDEDYINSLTWEEYFDHLAPAIIAYNDDHNHVLIEPNGDYVDTWAVMGYDSDDNLFITLAEQYGYAYTSVNPNTGKGSIDFVNPGMKSLMKKFNEGFTKHYFTTKGILGKNTNYLTTTNNALFAIGSTGGVKYQFSSSNPIDVGVAPIPQAEGKDMKMIAQGPSTAFLKVGANEEEIAKHAKGAWLFYKTWMSKDFGTDWAFATGYTPVRKSVAADEKYLAYCDETKFQEKTIDRLTARNATFAVNATDYLYTSPVFSGSAKARDAVGGLATDAIGNKGVYDRLVTDAEIDTYFNNAYANAI